MKDRTLDIAKDTNRSYEYVLKAYGKYRSVFHEGKSIMLIIDPDTGVIIDANTAAADYYGYSIDELKLMKIQQINALSEEEVIEKMQDAKQAKQHYFIFKHRLSNGEVRDVEVYSGNVVSNGENLLYSIVHDITESKKNEERFKRAEQIASIGSWEVNLNTKQVYASQGARNIFGLYNYDITVDQIQSCALAEYKELLVDSIKEMVYNDVPYDIEFKIFRTNDGKILDIRSIARYDCDSHSVIGVIKDITERKKIEEDLRKAKERAEEADRLKSAFLATISHELRTPLNAIIGLSDIIEENMEIDEIMEMNSVINSSGQKLLEIIDTILDISLFETKKFKVVKERFLLNRLLCDIKEFADKEIITNSNISIKYKVYGDIRNISICSDYDLIRKVIKNLLKNAIKFTEKGYVQLGIIISNGNVIFYVKDSGVGIPEEKKGIIFESFRQLDETVTRRYEGIGLGLTVCKRISDVLGGELWVESEKGIGSVFYFKLPDVDINYL